MEGKVLLQDLAQSLANNRNIQKKDAEIFLKAFFETISEGILQDKIVKIKGLGTFKMIEVQDRESVNVNTGERIVIPGHSKISFTPDAELKDVVNKPFALFQTVIINEGTSLEDMERIEPSGDNLDVESLQVAEEIPEVIPEVLPVVQNDLEVTEALNLPEEPVVQDIPEEPVAPLYTEPIVPKEPEDDQTTTVNNQLIATHETKWWHISPVMLALLFAFFWIVLLLGYLIGSKNWANIDQIFNKPTQEFLVSVDTVFVEKKVELDTAYIQNLEDSIRNIIQEEIKQKKEQPKAQTPLVTKPESKAESKPVATNKNGPVAYEIVGQKGVRTIQWGDYLLKIVRQEYGNDDALKYVILYNKFTDPNNLPVGTEVKLPKLKEK